MTLTVEEAQTRLPELVRNLLPGDEVAITADERTVARLVGPAIATPPPTGWQRPGPGLLKGMLTIVSEDDDHLKDFAEYMP